jgi:hypothetical protein
MAPLCRRRGGLCHNRRGGRDKLAQGFHWVCAMGMSRLRRPATRAWRGLAAWALALVLPVAATAAAAAGCPGPALDLQPLAPGLWLVKAAPGEVSAANRGRVANLLLAREGGRLWALGSGPSSALGRALACQAWAITGAPVRVLVSPWARPELVLGAAGLRQAAGGAALGHWAHADVARAMARRCARCAQRLRQQLGSAAVDLGGRPIALPQHRLQGAQGVLGPWRWWRLWRAPGEAVTVWRWQGAGAPAWWFAPGLLAGSGLPDGHDADLAMLRHAARQLQALAAADGEAAHWIGDQGGPLAADAPGREANYWDALLAAAAQAIDAGQLDTDPPPVLPGMSADQAAPTRHSLNWQRAWRQVEAAALAPR